MLKVLDRYILKELLGPFFFGLGAFTILFFAVESLIGVARMMSETDIPFLLVLEYLVCRLPQVMMFTLPMATLLSCLLTFGRLSGESELTALRASGISFLRIAAPALAFFFFLSLFSYWMNDNLVPQQMRRAYDIMYGEYDEEDQDAEPLRTSPRVLEDGTEQTLYTYQFDPVKKTMKAVYIHFFSNGKRVREVYADQARWQSDQWEFQGLRTVNFDEAQQALNEEVSPPESWQTLPPEERLQSPAELLRRTLRPEEMTRAEIQEALVLFQSATDVKLREDIGEYQVMYHQKASMPWISFIFATFAIPLGVRPHRSSKSVGLGLSLVFILIYYVLMTVGTIMGQAGGMDPELGAWLPNITFGILGLFSLLQASRS